MRCGRAQRRPWRLAAPVYRGAVNARFPHYYPQVTTAVATPGRSRDFSRLSGDRHAPRTPVATSVTPPAPARCHRGLSRPRPGHRRRRTRRRAPALREVLFVGNNWDGTADVIKSTGDFAKIGRINVVPDKDAAAAGDLPQPDQAGLLPGHPQRRRRGPRPVRRRHVLHAGRHGAWSSPGPASPTSSRSTCATGAINWRFPVSGYRADHMAVSPGRHAGRGVRVDLEHRARAGHRHRQAARLVQPPATSRTRTSSPTDGKYIWNMSIGEVNTALDDPWLDWTQGRPAHHGRRRDHLPAGQGRSTCGSGWTRSAARTCRTPSGRRSSRRTSRSCTSRCRSSTASWSTTSPPTGSPGSRPCRRTPRTSDDRTTWVNDSRHHGLSMSPDGNKLCVAGTMDDYATVVDRATLQEGPLVTGLQAVLGHGQRRRQGLRHLRERRRPGHRDRLRHRAEGRVRAGRRPPAARPDRPCPGRLDEPAGCLSAPLPPARPESLAAQRDPGRSAATTGLGVRTATAARRCA